MLGLTIPGLAVGLRQDGPATLPLTGPVLPAGVAVTRASPATVIDAGGALSSVGADQPRFDHDPLSGATRGLLVEPAATNLVTHAVATTAGWSALASTLSDLALGAMGLFPGVAVAGGGANWHRAQVATAGWSAGQPLQVSVWYVPGSSGAIMVNVRNLTTGVESAAAGPTGAVTPLSSGAGGIGAIENGSLGGGVRVVSFTFTPASDAGEGRLGVGPYSATAGADITVLAAQIEPGSSATSLILTQGAPASRAADVLRLDRWSGVHDIEIVAEDGSVETRAAVALAPGHVLTPVTARRLRRLRIL